MSKINLLKQFKMNKKRTMKVLKFNYKNKYLFMI